MNLHQIKLRGLQQLSPGIKRILSIPEDKDRLSQEDWELVDRIKGEFDLSQYSPGNHRFGPHCGISPGERLIRAYKLGLLVQKERAAAR